MEGGFSRKKYDMYLYFLVKTNVVIKKTNYLDRPDYKKTYFALNSYPAGDGVFSRKKYDMYFFFLVKTNVVMKKRNYLDRPDYKKIYLALNS